ncbi:MAG TPA: protein phosphatase 2C domain-containing protein [Polyangiaceae bacterium]|nr:protein phosphatase 2C domain-containing protein [Polyangiaceae bacterium]
MDQNLMVFGGIALLALIGGFVWSDRRAGQAKQESEKGRPAPVVSDKNNPATVAPPSSGRTQDEDVEITMVTTFPLAELEKARAKFRAATAPRADSEPDSEGAAPNVSAEPAGPDLGDRASRVELSFEEEADVEEVTSPVVRILVSALGDSDRGRKRARNEDSLLVLPERSLYAVADGMGGHAGGEVASALAVDVLRDAFERGVFEARTESAVEVPRRAREVACAIQMANEAIYAFGQSDPKLHKMGTTMVVARFSPNKQRVYIGHVGDSRCYRLRGSELRQLTKDHVMSTFGVTGPRGNDLYQAVGVQPTLSIDLIVDKPKENDLYLLCSDGLSKMATDDEVLEVLLQERDLDAAVCRLIALANDHGGRDNTTLILVKVLERAGKTLALGA